MQIVIDIDDRIAQGIIEGNNDEPRNIVRSFQTTIADAIKNGRPLDEKELKLKRWIEKDIETLNYIIESGWLISDYDKCTAIDACEDAITALKQYPVLDKVRAEIDKWHHLTDKAYNDGIDTALEIIDKYRGNVDEI